MQMTLPQFSNPLQIINVVGTVDEFEVPIPSLSPSGREQVGRTIQRVLRRNRVEGLLLKTTQGKRWLCRVEPLEEGRVAIRYRHHRTLF